ncbi:MAG: VOC family protein [Caldilineaceae bacterium]|nr:VOC family protein [Caldilineaceae bacterium]
MLEGHDPRAERPRFHLAFPVDDLVAARAFYAGLLGCGVGREDDRWIDFDFFGHQITAHLADSMPAVATNRVDGKDVPVSHFGAVLGWDHWQVVADRLRAAGVGFLIEPNLRFVGQPGEQATMFLLDPSGNGVELKSFRDPARLFARGA